jgi:hypothetical protein
MDGGLNMAETGRINASDSMKQTITVCEDHVSVDEYMTLPGRVNLLHLPDDYQVVDIRMNGVEVLVTVGQLRAMFTKLQVQEAK